MLYQVTYQSAKASPISVDFIESDKPITKRQVQKFLCNEGFKRATILSFLLLNVINPRYFWATVNPR